jgi:hypothetical protein
VSAGDAQRVPGRSEPRGLTDGRGLAEEQLRVSEERPRHLGVEVVTIGRSVHSDSIAGADLPADDLHSGIAPTASAGVDAASTGLAIATNNRAASPRGAIARFIAEPQTETL